MPEDFVTPFQQAAQLPQPDVGASLMQGIQDGLQQQVARQQVQRQLQQQRTLDAATREFIANPTAQSIRTLAALNPQGFAAIKTAHDQLSGDQQKQDLGDLAAVRGYLGANRPDDALSILQSRIDALGKSGGDTSNLQHLADAIKSDPKQAAGIVNYGLAAVLGPDKFGEAFGQIGGEQRTQAEEPGKLVEQQAKTDLEQAQAAQARAEAQAKLNPSPKTTAVPGAFNPDGSPIFYNENAPPPAAPLPASLDNFVTTLQQSENATGNPGAKNPNSTATGNGQFINSTWLQMLKQTRPDVAQGKTDTDLLALRADPQLSKQVTAAYAQVNGHALEAANLPVNGATLAMAHKLGPESAQTVLNADPGAKLSTLLPKPVLVANPQLAKLTAGEYAQGLAKSFGTNPIPVGTDPSNTAALTGEAYLQTLPPAKAAQIRRIANGDGGEPTGRSAFTGPGQLLMQQVLQYDPTASAINLDARKKTREAFTSGTEARAINSLNTVTGHMVGLSSAIDRLGNSDIALGNNTVGNVVLGHLDPSKQKALADFNFFKTAVSNELTKVFRGQNGAESDIQGWMKQLNQNAPPTALHSTVNAMIEGMKSRLESLGQQYSQGMGRTVDPLQLLSPHAQQQLQKLQSQQSQSAPKVVVNPQTGARLVYDPSSNSWKPG